MMHPMMVPRPQMMMQRPGFMPGPMQGFMPRMPNMPNMGPPGANMGPPGAAMGPPGAGMGAMPGPNMAMQAPSRPAPPQDEEDEGPAPKRPRTEEALVPEAEWSRRYPGIVKFRVSVPDSSDKAEWQLNGQTLQAAFSLAEHVSALKAFVHEQTGLPPAKQKLLKDGVFFKDSSTLAAYNIGPQCCVQLQLKERGGRKK